MDYSRDKFLQELSNSLGEVDSQDRNSKKIALISFFREDVNCLAGSLVTLHAFQPPTLQLNNSRIEQRTPPPRSRFSQLDDVDKAALVDLLQKHGLRLQDLLLAYASTAEGPLERIPCANVEASRNWKCQNSGKMVCSVCHLVSYCSKECQRKHWGFHKRDCKDPIRSPSWQPSWIRDKREPTFMSPKMSPDELRFTVGIHAWGNVPAIDTLNLSMNEGTSVGNKNIQLAYVASGDLRNIVRTVNELPSDYSGSLMIVLNDLEPMIVLRNILILLILGTIEDKKLAAECALHLWGSVYLQNTHSILVSVVMAQFMTDIQEGGKFSLKLGDHSTMAGLLSHKTLGLFAQMLRSNLSIEDAHTEMQRVRFEPIREDRHHREYIKVSPSHRLAFLEYRRFGLLLPFGAANHHFDTANKYLFSPSGKWMQNDYATPLDSWKIEDVVSAGKAHGAQSADLYGCLYFYLYDQLQQFVERTGRFSISFQMFDQDARDLGPQIRAGKYKSCNLSKDMAFDRIDVSNVIDNEYVGISRVLADWTPFLNKANPCATIVGYSMNWVTAQHNSSPFTDSKSTKDITQKLVKMEHFKIGSTNIMALHKYYVALYDTSAPFEEYIKKQDIDEAAQRAGCKRKGKHTIVPHRIGTPIDSPKNELPHFGTEESWYWNVQVNRAALSERYVEFACI